MSNYEHVQQFEQDGAIHETCHQISRLLTLETRTFLRENKPCIQRAKGEYLERIWLEYVTGNNTLKPQTQKQPGTQSTESQWKNSLIKTKAS